MRSHLSSKPKTYTERQYVNATGINVKDLRLTLGGLWFFFFKLEESAEAIVVEADDLRRAKPKGKRMKFAIEYMLGVIEAGTERSLADERDMIRKIGGTS